MALTQSSAAEAKSWIADPGRRRSMRVLLSVPITVTGKNARGETFTEETRTLVVNAHGALISLAATMMGGQRISVSNKATHKSIDCRVVHLGSAQAGKVQMGIEFEKSCSAFWQIDFPPDDWVVPEN
jgi:PilZ domain